MRSHRGRIWLGSGLQQSWQREIQERVLLVVPDSRSFCLPCRGFFHLLCSSRAFVKWFQTIQSRTCLSNSSSCRLEIADMARPKEFDPERALAKAMNVFWRLGYENTSLEAIMKETGIARQSLYD